MNKQQTTTTTDVRTGVLVSAALAARTAATPGTPGSAVSVSMVMVMM